MRKVNLRMNELYKYKTIKLMYLVIEDNKRIQAELIALADNSINFSANI